ncbi:phage tail protein [Nocardia brasiliensis]|uniref:phage tail protein n=1 Tax=Nocardia brasiliensis TaxID=37326 RepID=UPI002458F16B|nr:phage tail protein [Nocardia brasiliensis]
MTIVSQHSPRTVTLPSVYDGDQVVGAFAEAIDTILTPIDRDLDIMADLFDPWSAPREFLPWLAHICRAHVEPTWPSDPQLLRRAIELAPWLEAHRGTVAALTAEARYVYRWSIQVTHVTDDNHESSGPSVTLTLRSADPQLWPGEVWSDRDLKQELARLARIHCPPHLPRRIVVALDEQPEQ